MTEKGTSNKQSSQKKKNKPKLKSKMFIDVNFKKNLC